MNEEEAREIIDNMSEQELNDFIFFALQEVEKENQKLKTELKKKDKMIDEMATYIATLDIEEDICEKTKNKHCDKMNFGECEDCIKQYFERKVEEEK